MSLREMVAASGAIFAGRVESTSSDRIRGLPVTRVTFQVEENIRGAEGETITLTFLGGSLPNGLPYRVLGMPVFRPGERVVLLAHPASSIGLTSPAGLYQGCFRVGSGAAGLEEVTAPGPRRRLLEGIQQPEETVLAAGTGGRYGARGKYGAGGPVALGYRPLLDLLRELATQIPLRVSEPGPSVEPGAAPAPVEGRRP
jgi:hypothetical protein